MASDRNTLFLKDAVVLDTKALDNLSLQVRRGHALISVGFGKLLSITTT